MVAAGEALTGCFLVFFFAPHRCWDVRGAGTCVPQALFLVALWHRVLAEGCAPWSWYSHRAWEHPGCCGAAWGHGGQGGTALCRIRTPWPPAAPVLGFLPNAVDGAGEWCSWWGDSLPGVPRHSQMETPAETKVLPPGKALGTPNLPGITPGTACHSRPSPTSSWASPAPRGSLRPGRFGVGGTASPCSRSSSRVLCRVFAVAGPPAAPGSTLGSPPMPPKGTAPAGRRRAPDPPAHGCAGSTGSQTLPAAPCQPRGRGHRGAGGPWGWGLESRAPTKGRVGLGAPTLLCCLGLQGQHGEMTR